MPIERCGITFKPMNVIDRNQPWTLPSWIAIVHKGFG